MFAGRFRGRAQRSERGAVAVEVALILPVVFAVMFGVIQYGIYFWGRSTVAASARESARQLAVGTDWTCSRDQAIEKANAAASGAAATHRYLNGTNTAVVGTLVEVTLTAKSLAPNLLPLPGSGEVTEVATARVENIPATPLECS